MDSGQYQLDIYCQHLDIIVESCNSLKSLENCQLLTFVLDIYCLLQDLCQHLPPFIFRQILNKVNELQLFFGTPSFGTLPAIYTNERAGTHHQMT